TRFSRDWSSDVCSTDLISALADLVSEGRNVLGIVKQGQSTGTVMCDVATDGFLHFIASEQVVIFGYQTRKYGSLYRMSMQHCFNLPVQLVQPSVRSEEHTSEL